MAEELNQYKTISKNNAGFPEYLDFDRLRREGIDYLGKLSGKLWTDHNVHDPGITILEMLCYALLDLGYRTNLPVADILTRNPACTGADDNFFTPAQILTNNPLTITDFRKLLIDIPGVKNAWLEVAKDYNVESFCRGNDVPADPAGVPVNEPLDPCCDDFVNGLYRVYLDLENSIFTNLSKNEFNEAKKKAVLEKVRKALLAHRNFCEDFHDIRILCKLEVGVCADIELEDSADPEQVYLQMAEALYQFFSPAPTFYTLPQMLEKGKTIDEVFAGRPPDITESHGFIDTEELQNLPLRKEIHLSDVYNALLGIPGVKRVQRLRLRKCGENDFMNLDKWKFSLPENHVPEFSVKCSGVQFLRYGVPVPFNFQKYEALIEMNAVQQGKVLFTSRYPYLDSEIPKGIYRNDLDDYYSIQNEFPRVYGIGEGGLPDNAPALRRAQALQLKGYLLFFDQLLANYLSQLKNLRSLFSMKGAPDTERHTYFVNQLHTVPDLQKLLRFTSPEGSADAASPGSLLAFPVKKEQLLQQLASNDPCGVDIENAAHFLFDSLDKSLIAVNQLKDDFYHGNYEAKIVTKNDESVYYYILTSSDCFVLLSKKYFTSEEEARLAAESLAYVAGFEENYRNWITAGNDQASFDIAFNLADYRKYLQRIAEEPSLYQSRRQQFLDHLLARFAEQFTDYALLSYGALNDQQQQDQSIKAKEKYLSEYPGLSANRGKGYDYKVDGWNTENTSGFEKKFTALSGIENSKRHSLCNFEVARYNEKYMFNLPLGDALAFTSDKLYDTREEARNTLRNLLQAARQETSYRVEFMPQEQVYGIVVEYVPGTRAQFTARYHSADAAWQAAGGLYRMFNPAIAGDAIAPDSYKYTPILTDFAGNVLLVHNESAAEESRALGTALKHISKTGDGKCWNPADQRTLPSLRLFREEKSAEPVFIDTAVFKIDIDNTIVGKPDKYTYEMLDKNNSFKFRSVNEFENEKAAKEDYLQLLCSLISEENFHIYPDERTGKYSIQIRNGEKLLAESFVDYDSAQPALEAAAAIRHIINQHLYRIQVQKQPATWKFQYRLGYRPGEEFVFRSEAAYNSREEALEAAATFTRLIEVVNIHHDKDKTILRGGQSAAMPVLQWQRPEEGEGTGEQRQRLAALINMQRNIAALLAEPEQALDRYIDIDELSKTGLFVYRLVDKDNLYAFSLIDNADKNYIEQYREEAIRFDRGRYNFLDLQVKGDITHKRKDTQSNTDWYHYQLKSVNHVNKPIPGSNEARPLILFESSKGYETSEEAEKAFAKNYFHILRLAADPEAYRERRISTEEIFFHTTAPLSQSDPIVFVPKETLDFLGDYEDRSIEALIKVVKSYPLRTIYPKADCREFHMRFHACNEDPCPETNNNECTKEKENPVWYFVLFNKETDREDWQSVKYYASAAEAWKDFEFFLLLLKYPGNYHIDCSCRWEYDIRQQKFFSRSVYKIFIREVLAESARRFMTEEAAWGSAGVQHFIDVSQTPGAFHNYTNRQNCCFSFYVACPNTKLFHPCRYDTPEKRDAAMALLYRSLEDFRRGWSWFPGCKDQGSLLLKDFWGRDIATVRYENNDAVISAPNEFAWYTEIMQRIAARGLCIENETVYLKGKSISFIPATANAPAGSLKSYLLWLSQFYPFTSRETGSGNNRRVKYCLEIKLPGFSGNNLDDCCQPAGPKNHCWVAWKSDCCYNNCEEALSALNTALQLLSRFSNYKPVFDCDCHSYGIAIHFENMLTGDLCGYPDPVQRQVILPCEHAIAAYNPQCYPNAQIACKAVERAKALINSEGLHVVEHILLRPRCPEHCNCRLRPCGNEFAHCEFPYWKQPTDDPCHEERPVCFKPGYDPYSFIATVVLPAWPEQFRNKDNRLLLENILYREAPAHVLLRIIWLAPHDFCCFEKYYKQWIKWMGQKKTCMDFDWCGFMQFLFFRQFECLPEPRGCTSCSDDEQVANPCVTLRGQPKKRQESESYLSQVNTTFCWRNQDCGDYVFLPCSGSRDEPDQPGDPDLLRSVPEAVTPAIAEPATPALPLAQEQPAPARKPPRKKATKKDESTKPGIASKSKFINSRFARYRKEADETVNATRGAKAAVMLRRFLDNTQPAAPDLKKVAAEILAARADKKNKLLNKKRATTLLSLATRYYLDKWAFDGKDMEQLQSCSEVFESMRHEKMDLADIYRLWESDALKKYEPDLDMNAIKYLLTGNK